MSLLSKLFSKIENLPERFWWLISLSLIVLYYLPYFILGEDVSIYYYDNLNSNISWVKILLDNNALFAEPSKEINTSMNGLPRYQIYPLYDFSLVVFNVFDIFWGYVINRLIISLIAFFGLHVLLKHHVLHEYNNKSIIQFLISSIFAILPFWSFTATIMGVPLALYAFLEIRKENYSWLNWFYIAIFAFHSSLILSGAFLLFVISIVWLTDYIRVRKIQPIFILATLFFVVVSAITNWPSFYALLYQDQVSFRAFSELKYFTLNQSFEVFIKQFFYGRYQAVTLHFFILPPALFVLFLYFRDISKRTKLALLYVFIVALFAALYNYEHFAFLRDFIWDIIPIRLERFWFLDVTFVYIALSGIFIVLYNKSLMGRLIVLMLILFQILYVFYNHEAFKYREDISYREYYSSKTFLRIKKFFDYQNSKVVCVGISPAIANYNGINTFGGYYPNYAQSHKENVYSVQTKEIVKNKVINENFLANGAECYFFSSKLNLPPFFDQVTNHKAINGLDYDYKKLNSLGVNYIISSLPILGEDENLRKIGFATNEKDEFWNIHLYQIITNH